MYCVDPNASSPSVVHVIPGGKEVNGVTSLGDDVFVARWVCQQKIEVYDAKTFTLQRDITIPGLVGCYGLAACPYNNCLYASDGDNDSVHKVELSGSNAVMKWSVAGSPRGLSVNNEHNLIVASHGERRVQIFSTPTTLLQRRLQIFTTHGTLLQDIQLQVPGGPYHAVQLPTTSQFLVNHAHVDCSLHRVCLVGVDGAVVLSSGGQAGSELKQMNWPCGLAVDREERVLVADFYNDRLLVLDQSLSNAHEMSISVDRGLKRPRSLWYDQSRRRLYIGEWNGRVIVIDDLKDFSNI